MKLSGKFRVLHRKQLGDLYRSSFVTIVKSRWLDKYVELGDKK
jgi:hypothetical protein